MVASWELPLFGETLFTDYATKPPRLPLEKKRVPCYAFHGMNPTKTYESDVSWWWTAPLLLILGILLFGKIRAQEPPPPPALQNDEKWDRMVSDIRQKAEQYNGDVGVYIKSLKTGRVFEYHTDHTFVSASLIKLPVMIATFDAIKEGRISLNTRIRYKREFWRDGSGHMKYARFGSYYPLSYLIYQMMTKSDNTATAMIIDLLGYDYLNQRFESMGLQATRIRPTGMSLANRLPNPDLDNYTTPREMAGLLEKMYRHQFGGDNGLNDLMLEIMKGANAPSRLKKNLPHDWQFARKTGLLRKNCHDVGIVFSPEGDYVLCVLTNGYARNYRVAKNLISDVGRETYQYIGNAS
jgi:beta-lactamase class A